MGDVPSGHFYGGAMLHQRCPRAVELWQAMAKHWSLPDLNSVRPTGIEWLFNVLYPMQIDDRMRVLMVLWRAWHIRNEIVYEKRPHPVGASCRFLLSYEASLAAIQRDPDNDHMKGKMVLTPAARRAPARHPEYAPAPDSMWQAPAPGRVKLNVDVSYCPASGAAGAGMILRDNNGAIIFSACRNLLFCADPLQAELAACLEGLNFAMQWSPLLVDVEMDSLIAVQAIRSMKEDKSQHAMMITEAKRLLGERESSVAHISRRQNCVGHRLAEFGRVEARTVVWLKSGPANVPELCMEDLPPS
ncbi:hypothetical protein VPH35_004650 [Triticum aestivum]